MSSKKDRRTMIELPITDDLKNCSVTRFVKEGSSNLMLMCGHDNRLVFFCVQKDGLFATLEDFAVKASKGKVLDQKTREKIKFCLTQGDYPELILNTNYGKSSCSSYHSGTSHQAAVKEVSKKYLDLHIPNKDYVEYIIQTIKKRVKQEDLLVRLLVYVGLTVYSNNPLCIGIRAPTSEGKTYAVIQSILKFFPKDDLMVIGSMSPKALIRQNGVLVDKNGNPVEDKIRELNREIRECGGKDTSDIKEELVNELDQLYKESKMQINLCGKILLFLERPDEGVWDVIKSTLSHDTWEITHNYVDVDLKTKKIKT